MQINDEGMPVYGHSQIKGALYIQFEVKFPDSLELTEAQRKVLKGILAPPGSEAAASLASAPPVDKDYHPSFLEDLDIEVRKILRH